MSAKDEFFNKLQVNKNSTESRVQRVMADIKGFQLRMDKLIEQISEWLNGSGIEVIPVPIVLNDETIVTMPGSEITALSRYGINKLKLSNADKFATFTPIGVYGGEAKGWVELIVSPNGIFNHNSLKFRLKYDDSTSVWFIRKEPQTLKNPVEQEIFTEEVFFKVISGLA